MADEPRHYELDLEPAHIGIEGMPLGVSVSKQISVTIEGYRRAVERLRRAIDADDGLGVYTGVTEAATWATSLADRPELKDDQFRHDPDLLALKYARDRSHHQWASVVEPEDEGWCWRAADSLPTAGKEEHQGLKHKLPSYKRHLEGKPVFEGFERLTPVIDRLDS